MTRELSQVRRGERGSALVAVLGLMIVLAIVTITIGAVTVQAAGTTTSSRAGVQSHAAADAGLDVALARLKTTNGCTTGGNVLTSTVVPIFTSTISYSLNSGSTWTDACPPNSATHVRITSVGTAEQLGAAGASSGDKSTVQAIYKWVPIIVQVPIDGAAVYANSVDGVLKKFNLSSADNSVATSVMVKTGDVECTNNAKIGGDLILGDGNAKLNACDVAGKIHVNGNVVIDASNVGGSIWATGTVSIAGSTYNSATVRSGATVPIPAIPNWTDIKWDPAHWTGMGYNIVNWTGSCDISKNNAAGTKWAQIATYITPTVVNFLNACPNNPVTTSNSMDYVALKSNIVLVANEFTFDKLYFSATTARTLTFLVPDDVPNGQPTCIPTAPSTLKGDIYLTNETDFGTNIAAMVYTPCKIRSDRNGFRGQLYGGEAEFNQQASLEFVPVGVQGIDLSGGLTNPVQTGAKLGDPLSTLDVG
ncbi:MULTISPECIES: hypothetical protein [unclassified Cryobacterium]|uniref:hypothetical protein n=1 Tax=unclassified Cryobacterium TaxID=2649013 RepID=UPI001F541920|nr:MULTISPECIES: hypothetical protein [unclassified Cryobacterium]